MSTVELKKVCFSYGHNEVLKNIDLCFNKGKIHVVFGPSGSGKTTLLALIGGLDIPAEGCVLFEGKDIVNEIGLERYRRENVSFIFQNYNLIEYLTAIENVRLVSKNKDDKDPYVFLEDVGISHEEAKRNVLGLSGGEQQRVAIARALASERDIILADEPTGNLDSENAQTVLKILCDAAKNHNKCVIVASHWEEFKQTADSVYELPTSK